MRLSYRKPPIGSVPLIWQGFVRAGRKGYNDLLFDMRAVYNNLKWESMRSFLCQCVDLGFAFADHPDSLALLYEAFDNLRVTVVALERASPYRASLVVATGGFNDPILLNGPFEQGYLLNPRNVNSHGIRRDEDWIKIFLVTATKTDPIRHQQQGEFCGLSLSHEW